MNRFSHLFRWSWTFLVAVTLTLGLAGCDGDDGAAGAAGTPGAAGPAGTDGLACWDLNGNGVGDPEEDINGDGVFDTAVASAMMTAPSRMPTVRTRCLRSRRLAVSPSR